MRTLKFRSYDTVEQAYCPFITDHLDRELYPHIDVQQWTGLLSKDGVEIYEGDILNGTCMYKVRLAHGQWEIVVLGADKPWYQIFGNTHLLEVVGNIYENPDLLTPTEGGKTE